MRRPLASMPLLLLAFAGCGDGRSGSDDVKAPDATEDAGDVAATDAQPDDGADAPDAAPDAGTDDASDAADAADADVPPPVPVAIARFEILPQPLHVGEVARVRVDTTGAESCTLTLEDWNLSISRAQLADGVVEVVPPVALVAALAVDRIPARPATLTCTGPSGVPEREVATARAAVLAAPGPPVGLVVSPASRTTAGTVEACWTAPEGAVCDVYVAGSPVSAQVAEGCLEDLPIEVTTTLDVWCSDDSGSAGASVVVPVGPAVARFEAQPTVLAGPGETTLRWSAPGTGGCSLIVPGTDTQLTLPESGERDVAVTATTVFVLACDGQPEWPLLVEVVPRVEVYRALIDATHLILGWSGRFAETCAVEATSGDNVVARSELGPDDGWYLVDIPPIATGSWIAGVTCDGPFGSARDFVQLTPRPPVPAIDEVTVDPPVLPVGGGFAEVCWRAEWASRCALYWDGSGDAEGEGEGVGCASRLVQYTTDLEVECCGDPGCRRVSLAVPVGGAIVALTAQPARLDGPGEVTVRWSTTDVDRCVLTQGGAPVADALAHTGLTLSLAETTTLTLRCARGSGYDTRTLVVPVGAGIETFAANASPSGLEVRWTTSGVTSCALDVVAGDAEVHFSGLAGETRSDVTKSGLGPFALPVDLGALAAGARVTLTCALADGGADTETVEVPPAVPVAIESFAADPVGLDAAGAVDLCWDSVGADWCRIYWSDAAGWELRDDLAPSGCLSTLGRELAAIGATTSFDLACWGALGMATATTSAVVGPGIERFEVSSEALDAPGSVDVAWASHGFASCAVTRDGDVVATGLEGAESVAFPATGTLRLVCRTAGGDGEAREVRVAVGPTILDFGARAVGPEGIETSYRAVLVDACALALRPVAGGAATVFDGLPTESANGWSYPIMALGDASATLTCTGPGGTTSKTVVIEAPEAPALTRLELTAAALPPGGGPLDVCWAATGVDGCWVQAGPFGAQGGASGCLAELIGVPLVLLSSGDVILSCGGVGGSLLEQRHVPVGPDITTFAIDPPGLAAPGPVAIRYTGDNAEACALTVGGEVASTAREAVVERTLDATTEVVLTCRSGDAEVSRRALVPVGPALVALAARAEAGGGLSVSWSAFMADACTVELSTPEGVVVEAQVDLPAEGSAWFWSYDLRAAPADVTVICRAGDTLLEGTTRVPRLEPLVITSLDASPLGLDGSGVANVCWSTSDPSASCVLDWTAPPGGAQRGVGASGCLVPDVEPAPLELDLTAAFSLSCWAAGGSTSRLVKVPVGPGIAAFDASPGSLDGPGEATLSWRTFGAARCDLVADGVATPVATESTGTKVAVDATTRFVLRCEGADGEPFEQALTVALEPAILRLDALPVSATVLWIALAAPGMEMCGITLVPADGSPPQALGELWTGTTWWDFARSGDLEVLATCFIGGRVLQQSVAVATPLPTITRLEATPSALAAPGEATLCWAAEGADGCRLTVGDAGWEVAAAGCALDLPEEARTFGATTAVVLTCDNSQGATEARTVVSVGPSITRLEATPASVPRGGFYATVTWETAFVASCALADAHGVIATTASGAVERWVGETTTFTLTCADPAGGDLTATVEVPVR